MPPKPRPLVVVLSAPGTLPELEAALLRRGLDARRVNALRLRRSSAPRPSAALLRRAAIDTVVVTSPHADGPVLRAWCRPFRDRRAPQLWVAGPESARQLRARGYGRVRAGPGLGAAGIVRALGTSPRRVLHVRSDLAGSELARALRARGHSVREVVAYRVEPDLTALRRAATLLTRTSAVVPTSPSVVSALRRGLGGARFARLAHRAPAYVLGDRTARAARLAGFRRVVVVRTTSPQRFARLVLRAGRHATE